MDGVSLSLPMPPSVNALWRARRGASGKPQFYLDRRYATWKRVADNIIMATRPKPRIRGHFAIYIVLDDRKRRGDADNRAKALLDTLQRAGVIEDDKLANHVSIGWGPANGCHVSIVSIPGEKARAA